jgi:hypothetical protein
MPSSLGSLQAALCRKERNSRFLKQQRGRDNNWVTGWTGQGSNPSRGKRSSPKSSRQALGPTQNPVQWVTGFFPQRLSGQGVKLTTHLHLMAKFKMSGAIPLLPLYVVMAWTGTTLHTHTHTHTQIYIYIYIYIWNFALRQWMRNFEVISDKLYVYRIIDYSVSTYFRE